MDKSGDLTNGRPSQDMRNQRRPRGARRSGPGQGISKGDEHPEKRPPAMNLTR